MTRNRQSAKSAGRHWELAVARALNKWTPCTVARRARTMPDTGDIEGLHAVIDGTDYRFVVECKNTLPTERDKNGNPVKRNGHIVYRNDFAGQWRETMTEAHNDGPNSLGVLAKKMPRRGAAAPGILRQPIVMTLHTARLLNLALNDNYLAAQANVWDVLSTLTKTMPPELCSAYKWYWQGTDNDPLIVTTVNNFCLAIVCTQHRRVAQ